ncbi:A disintegrin and metalloproteinase with thrombospondin motifs like [Ruditapes philippinarum]|uniref:A disintegrin and metalloproteinase with thrombospondin motifs like n=1 Tax=Ruditapes philippinarum TaxID=129788 RepID=UPI00295BF722|nr:A disintegrin and metalloproteinase with thrombospondin motifs like [Ruditapes philippinarum]XP_060553404.1 A disintegrin and metalloproteinase with thrombospondin motifs like [Ruditapes philippinarum]
MKNNKMIVLLLTLASVSAFEHYVSLRDMTPEPGLPEHILMDVIGSDDKITRLHLKENKRLNVNADIYEQDIDRATLRRLETNNKPVEDIKYYHDVQNRAAVSVTCEKTVDDSCKRTLEGFLTIGKETYEIRPVSNLLVTRMLRALNLNVHVVNRVVLHNRNFAKMDPAKKLIGLKDYIGAKKHRNIKQRGNTYKRQQQTEYAVECIVVIDPYLWKKFYERTKDSNDKKETTRYRLRRHLTHVMNGVSLMYESIEDPELNIYVTISGFIYYEKDDDTSPVPKGKDAPIFNNNKPFVDGDKYITYSQDWLKKLSPMKNDDHVMIFTGCELFDGDIENTGMVGIAFTGGACSEQKLSLQQDAGYYDLTTTAAHELGHNLNADHDGESNNCRKEDMYLMAPITNQLSYNNPYKVNPWRFSPCSIKSIKNFFQSEDASCMTDHGDYFDKTEWDKHNKKLPGELHTLDQQCKLHMGDYSGVCPTKLGGLPETDERICQELLCIGKGGCPSYTPARGSPCGKPGANKWCINGKCVPGKVKVIETPHKECFETTAIKYNGQVSVTKSGKECLLWSDVTDAYYYDYYVPNFPEIPVEGASNYCRAPGGEVRPWCYILNEDELDWEFCDIGKC